MENMLKKIKSGFTLAESLIALVVLGIILTFILPSLISTKPSENKLLYKKTFFTVSEAMMAVINNSEFYDTTKYDALLYPYLKDSTSSENFCEYMANYLNTVGQIKCTSNPGSLKLANGVAISNIPIKYKDDCKSFLDDKKITKVCTLYVDTSGKEIDGVSDNEKCDKKRTSFKINIASNGKVYTNHTWPCENSILETGTRVQMDNDKE